jgi:glycosyltransferase involved in cell wall biosynthesis
VQEAERLRVAMTVEQCWQPVPGGSGTYIRELVREYAGMPDLSVTGLSAWHTGPPPEGSGLPLPLRRVPLPRAVLYETWQRARLPTCGRGRDVVHATTWAIPGSRAPLVVTVHDLAFLHDPEHFTARGVAFFRRGLQIVREEAAAVVVPSEVTRQECVVAGLDGDRIHVVPHGVRPATTSAEQVVEFRERFGLRRPYILWAGTREPRKNLPVLLAAFSRVLDEGADLDLVLAGPDGWGPERDRLTRTQSERVRLIGRVSRADLDAAYAGARVFCYPSLREGYGMPVTEAMAHGTPVVTSRGTATEEAAGGAALLVDPQDEVDVARALREAAEDGRQETLRAASARRAAVLSWATSARATADVLRGAATQRRSPGRRRRAG